MSATVDRQYARSSKRPLLVAGMPGDRMVSGLVFVTFDNSYPTGGEAVDLSDIFPNGVIGAFIPPTATHFFVYDIANSKLLAYQTSDATQVTNGSSDLDGVEVAVFAFGLD